MDSSIPGVAAMKPRRCTMNSFPGATSIGKMWPGKFEAKAMTAPPCAVYVVIMKLARPPHADRTHDALAAHAAAGVGGHLEASDIQLNSPASDTTDSPSASESSSTGIVVPWIVSSMVGLLGWVWIGVVRTAGRCGFFG